MKDITLEITVDEANIILEALGNLPFARVYVLIGKIQEQAGRQINADGAHADAKGVDQASPGVEVSE